jgi:Nitrous oxide-stimulated promoter
MDGAASMIIQFCPEKNDDPKVIGDLKTLAKFIEVYCDGHHDDADREAVELKTHNLQELTGKQPRLCPDCQKLLAHALVKRTVCPMDPKPQCKHCPKHCYHPNYRQKIQEVMKYSGRKLVMHGRVDYLLHLLF